MCKERILGAMGDEEEAGCRLCHTRSQTVKEAHCSSKRLEKGGDSERVGKGHQRLRKAW